MTLEANVWNKNNSAWRELKDSTTVQVDVSTQEVVSLKVPTGAIGPTQLADTAVVAGSYTLTSLTVDADGRLTAASNGSVSPGITRGQVNAMIARADMT